MRCAPDPQLSMLSSLSTEDLIPVDHPIRRIRVVVDAVLADLDEVFDGMYAAGDRASVPPETLLKATVLMAMHSIRSERGCQMVCVSGRVVTRLENTDVDDEARS